MRFGINISSKEVDALEEMREKVTGIGMLGRSLTSAERKVDAHYIFNKEQMNIIAQPLVKRIITDNLHEAVMVLKLVGEQDGEELYIPKPYKVQDVLPIAAQAIIKHPRRAESFFECIYKSGDKRIKCNGIELSLK